MLPPPLLQLARCEMSESLVHARQVRKLPAIDSDRRSWYILLMLRINRGKELNDEAVLGRNACLTCAGCQKRTRAHRSWSSAAGFAAPESFQSTPQPAAVQLHKPLKEIIMRQ